MSVLSLQANSRPASTGCLAGCQLTAEGAVALLQPQRLDRVVAAAADPEVLARRHQVLVHADRELGGHVELPAQFADVGDPGGAHRGVAQRDLPAGRRTGTRRRTGRRRSARTAARATRGPITPKTAYAEVTSTRWASRRRAGARGSGPWSRSVVAALLTIEELVGAGAGDGHVGLVGAARVEHAGVDRRCRPRRRRRRCTATAAPRSASRPDEQVLGERRLVEDRDRRRGCWPARRPTTSQPVRLAPGVLDRRLAARRGRRSWPAPSPSCCRSWRPPPPAGGAPASAGTAAPSSISRLGQGIS